MIFVLVVCFVSFCFVLPFHLSAASLGFIFMSPRLFAYKKEGLRKLRAKRRHFSFILHRIDIGSHESELPWVEKKSVSLSSNTAKS